MTAKGIDAEGYVLYSYAGVQVIKQAAEAAKSLDPKKVAAQIHSGMTFQTRDCSEGLEAAEAPAWLKAPGTSTARKSTSPR